MSLTQIFVRITKVFPYHSAMERLRASYLLLGLSADHQILAVPQVYLGVENKKGDIHFLLQGSYGELCITK